MEGMCVQPDTGMGPGCTVLLVFPPVVFRIPLERLPHLIAEKTKAQSLSNLWWSETIVYIYWVHRVYGSTPLFLTRTLGGPAVVLTGRISDLPGIAQEVTR